MDGQPSNGKNHQRCRTVERNHQLGKRRSSTRYVIIPKWSNQRNHGALQQVKYIGLWCNGNTTAFGAVVQGSSPCRPSKLKMNFGTCNKNNNSSPYTI